MARKKQEIALQLEINTQEEWDELMKKEGLLVVDVYQDWCGPCKAVTNFFRRIKNEIGDDFLNFAVAKADTIDSLDKYRGKCEPCFLIYGGRSLVGVIRGANPPVLETTIKLKLEEEHKVMKGEMERKETKDPMLADLEFDEKVQEVDTQQTEVIEREVTLALIKPDVVKSGKVEEIIEKLHECGIEILAQQERNLTIDEAKELYHHMEETEFFEELIKFIVSGPSYVLVLAKGDHGIIHEFRELIGPKVLDEAKEKAPNSIRAIYGTTSIENAIHGADDRETAQRELAFFFPDFVVPRVARQKHEETNVQRTLALIRPAAFSLYKDSILEKIDKAGFKIAMQKEVQLTKEDAELFYKVHKDKPFFEELITEMSRGTLLALAIEKQNAVQGWRGMLGPKDVEKAKEIDPNSLRAQFYKEDLKINLLHGSDSEESAAEELKYFFPVEQTIAAIKPDGIENEEEIMTAIVNAKFQVVKSKVINMDRNMAEEFYSDVKDQDYFNDLVAHMESGPTIVVILSREDAIRGWRSLMGPKDPKIAEEAYPDSIRAIYGRDITKNSVYGSDNENEVQRIMNLIFGSLEFNENGTLLPQYMEEPHQATVTHEKKIVVEESKEGAVIIEESHAESPRLFDSSERIIMEPEVSEQPKITDMEEKTALPEEPEAELVEHEQSELPTEEAVIVTEERTDNPVTEELTTEQHSTEHVTTEHVTTEHVTTEHVTTEHTENFEEETVNVTEISQEPETIVISEENQNQSSEVPNIDESQQDTVVTENDTTLVEDPSIIETKEEITVVEETVVSQNENIDSVQLSNTDDSKFDNDTAKHETSEMESSHQDKDKEATHTIEEITEHDSSLIVSSHKEERKEISHDAEEKTEHDISHTEVSQIEKHTEETHSVEEKTEHESSHKEISQKEEHEEKMDIVEEKTESKTGLEETVSANNDSQSKENNTEDQHKTDNEDNINTDLNTVPE